MKKCFYCLLLVIPCFSIHECKAQESVNYYNCLADAVGNRALYLMLNQVIFSPSDGFYCNVSDWKDLDTFLRSPDYTYWASPPSTIGYCLRNADKNILTLICIPPIYSKDGTYIYYPGQAEDYKAGKDLEWARIDRMHLNSISLYLHYNTAIPNIRNHSLHYHSTSYAHRAFNADTVISFPLKIWDKKMKRKYQHAQGMAIQKNGRGHILLITFYTDKTELNHYLHSLEKTIWYRDPEDFLDFQYEEPQVTVTLKEKNKK